MKEIQRLNYHGSASSAAMVRHRYFIKANEL